MQLKEQAVNLIHLFVCTVALSLTVGGSIAAENVARPRNGCALMQQASCTDDDLARRRFVTTPVRAGSKGIGLFQAAAARMCSRQTLNFTPVTFE
jgi:hypothetical protein